MILKRCIKAFNEMTQAMTKRLFIACILMSPLTISARKYYPRETGDPILDAFSTKIELILICGFIIFLLFAIIVDVIMLIKTYINKKYSKPYNLDKGGYTFVSRVDSKSFKESGEQPKSTYKSISKAIQDSIYIKDGKYFYDWGGKFLPIEENPYYGDTSIGEWGEYKYRYKVTYETTKYCQQGMAYHYFNFPTK